MHVHLPKPLHGWREFAGEVGIIVIGVLIALTAEQVVERWGWNEQVSASREALRSDYTTIVVNARERIGEDGCIRRRLNELTAILSASHGTLPPLGDIGSPPERGWYPASWDGLVAAGIVTRMPRQEMLSYSNIAGAARGGEETSQQELYDWATIYSMVGPGRELQSGEAAQIRKALQSAMYRLNLLRLMAPQLEAMVFDTKILAPADVHEAKRQLEQLRHGANWQAICSPIPRPSGVILAAPYDPAIQKNPMASIQLGR